MYYETEIPSLTRISLHGVLTNLVNTNFAQHDFFQEPKVVGVCLKKQALGQACIEKVSCIYF